MPAKGNERFQALRHILHDQNPNRRTWRELCHVIEGFEGESLFVALEYATAHTADWPDELRHFEWSNVGDWLEHPPAWWPLVRSVACGNIGNEGALALASSPRLSILTCLDFSYEYQNTNNRLYQIGDEGAASLANSPYIGSLLYLSLSSNSITCLGVQALASSPHLSALKYLDLSHNCIEDSGARALAASPYLGQLTHLLLATNWFTGQGVHALTHSRHLDQTIHLDLGDSNLSIQHH